MYMYIVSNCSRHMYMYMYLHKLGRLDPATYTCTFVHVHVHCVHVCRDAYTHTHTHTHTCSYMHVGWWMVLQSLFVYFICHYHPYVSTYFSKSFFFTCFCPFYNVHISPCSGVGHPPQLPADNCSQRGLQFLCLFIKAITKWCLTRSLYIL